jgi:hypothetical protein
MAKVSSSLSHCPPLVLKKCLAAAVVRIRHLSREEDDR